MKRKQCAIKSFDFSNYDFSDCVEITGDALYLINGGKDKKTSSASGKKDSTSQGSGNKGNSNSESYTVQKNDTLSQIVYDYNKEHGTKLTVNDVAKASGISNPDLIHPGQQISFTGGSTNKTTTTSGNGASSYGSTGSYSSSSSNTSNTKKESEKPLASSGAGGDSKTVEACSNLTERGYCSSTAGYGNVHGEKILGSSSNGTSSGTAQTGTGKNVSKGEQAGKNDGSWRYQGGPSSMDGYGNVHGEQTAKVGAWEVKNQWTPEYQEKYSEEAPKIIEGYKKAGKKFTCEDLALSTLIDFASENNLPVLITNGTGSYSSSDPAFKSVEDFKTAVLTTTGAKDIRQNTVTVESSNLNAGDLICMDSGIDTNNMKISEVLKYKDGEYSHIQIVTKVEENFYKISQGNKVEAFYRTASYGSSLYAGMEIQSRAYDYLSDAFYGSKNEIHPNATNGYGMSFCIWDYEAMNNAK